MDTPFTHLPHNFGAPFSFLDRAPHYKVTYCSIEFVLRLSNLRFVCFIYFTPFSFVPKIDAELGGLIKYWESQSHQPFMAFDEVYMQRTSRLWEELKESIEERKKKRVGSSAVVAFVVVRFVVLP